MNLLGRARKRRALRRLADEFAVTMAMRDGQRHYSFPLSQTSRLSIGRLHSALIRMETRGEVVSGWDDQPSARRWYRLTPQGMWEATPHVIPGEGEAEWGCWDEPTAGQEFIVVSSTPQETGPPLYAEVDPLLVRSYRLDDTDGSLSLSVALRTANLGEPVAERLREPHRKATELWMYEDGNLVLSGPLRSWSISKCVLTLRASVQVAQHVIPCDEDDGG